MTERYEDDDTLAAHSNAAYFKAVFPELMECCEGPPQVALFVDVN
jgi:quinol monooxygenase YgiN